jgi:hypothetical protein
MADRSTPASNLSVLTKDERELDPFSIIARRMRARRMIFQPLPERLVRESDVRKMLEAHGIKPPLIRR